MLEEEKRTFGFFLFGGIYVGLLKIRIVDKKAEEAEDRRQKVCSKKKKGRSLQTKKREQSDGEVVEWREWREGVQHGARLHDRFG